MSYNSSSGTQHFTTSHYSLMMEKPIPIAIIGMSCRLPGGANTPEKLWDMLYSGRDGHGPIPPSRWNAAAFYHPDPEARESLPFKHGHFLQDDISAFDARFWRILPRDASGMDPQQRILLELTYEALENAGLRMEDVRGSNMGVYIAEFVRDYDRMMLKDPSDLHRMHALGAGDAILANRISYLLDLKGPSFVLDTGCSGSMVAVHQACQSIRTGETNVAIAGACQLIMQPEQSMYMSTLGMMNPDGKCYVWDEKGNGYGRGEGGGVLVLKRLDHALRDNDPVQAIIANTGVNQDGKTSGIQLPNGEAQAALARSVYAGAQLDPAETLYVEAHGTGTQAGDKEEIGSIYSTFCQSPGRKYPLNVGSIKANIGHLESASGVAALIKSVMILKKGIVPSNIRLQNLKPSIEPFVGQSLLLPRQTVPLVESGHIGPRRISVNGFGYGGTNAHVILESAEVLHDHNVVSGQRLACASSNTKPPRFFILSAATESSLFQMRANLVAWLTKNKPGETQFRHLAHSLTARRSLQNWHISAVATDMDSLMQQLSITTPVQVTPSAETQVTFIFTGQGAQWYAMGRELLQSCEQFRSSIDNASNLLHQWGCPWNLTSELLKSESDSRMNESELSQPATTAIQVALVDLLAALGIVPQRVLGHSSGEIAAAYAAGALTHEAAMKVAYLRGVWSKMARIMNASSGAMLSVGLGEDATRPYLRSASEERLVMACVNSPESTTVSGDKSAIDSLSTVLAEKGIFNRKLKVETAYHSHHMLTVVEGYLQTLQLQRIEHSSVRSGVSFFSTVSGHKKESGFGPAYWVENLVSPVQFYKALSATAGDIIAANAKCERVPPGNVFIEIGPHAALKGPARQVLSATSGVSPLKYIYTAPLMRAQDAVHSTLQVVSQLVQFGHASINLTAVASLCTSAISSNPLTLTDLPPYPWDHTTKYWHESRLSRDSRFRKFPYHDLLGILDVTSGTELPRWRHHIDPESMPWIRDHVVDGFILYPGTGYISMAIEALSQICQLRGTARTLSKFHLRDIKFIKPLVISQPSVDQERQAVEIILTLTPDGSASSAVEANKGIVPWQIFRVSSYDKLSNLWTEHCTGKISAQMLRPIGEVLDEASPTTSEITQLRTIKNVAIYPRDPTRFYTTLSKSGNLFGPAFRSLTSLNLGHLAAHGTVQIPDIAETMPVKYQSPHLIHPATLDALNHLAAAMYQKHCGNRPFVAAGIDELTISSELSSAPGKKLIVAGKIESFTKTSAAGITYVFQTSDDGEADARLQPVLTLKGWRMQSVGEARTTADTNGENAPFSRNKAYRMQWQPDVEFLGSEEFNAQLAEKGLYALGFPDDCGPLETAFLHESAALIYIKRTLASMQEKGLQCSAISPHLSKLWGWMAEVVKPENKSSLPFVPEVDISLPLAEEEREEIILSLDAKRGAQGLMLQRMGSQLEGILTGNVDPLGLMFQDDLIERVYAEDMMATSYAQMAEYVKMLSFKNPRLKILEIGAGTGGATEPILRALDNENGVKPLFDRYHYTDVSSGFFEKARQRFAVWQNKMEFSVLDISKNLVGQGNFEDDQKYDLVIAANVLHATPNLDVTVSNCRKLLRPGGRMILMEFCRPILIVSTIFGCLPGWWMSEDGRIDSPVVSMAKWEKIVKRHSFAGVEVASLDRRDESAGMAAMVCRAIEDTCPSHDRTCPVPATILTNGFPEALRGIVTQLQANISQEAVRCTTATIADTKHTEEASYIFLDIAENSILKDPSPATFYSLRKIVTSAKHLVWVSLQADVNSPDATSVKGMINGFARVVRNENPYIRLATLDVRGSLYDDRDIAEYGQATNIATQIAEIANIALSSSASHNSIPTELEYALDQYTNQILIPRLHTDRTFLGWVTKTQPNSKDTTLHAYHDVSRPVKLEPEVPGLLNTLRFVDDEIAHSPLEPWQIAIQPHAYGVNFKDVFVALGQSPAGSVMVGEHAGVVSAVGVDMVDYYQVGDRVAAMGAESMANCPRVHGMSACKLPDSVSFVDGAAVTVVFATAWYSMITVGKLQKGESILIHSGSGGVGQAAIQIALYIGAKIYTTVGSSSKRQLLIDTYHIPPDQVFSSNSTAFRDSIVAQTHGKGVDMVLNSLAGEYLRVSIECVAPFGRFIEIGKADIYKKNDLGMACFDKGISFTAVDFVLIINQRPWLVHQALKEVFELFEKGALTPTTPVTTFPMADVEKAFRMIANREHMGKLVLVPGDEEMVMTTVPTPRPLELDGHGTYVVVGGLGDLGRQICLLLARSGAGCVVTLSRTLPSKEILDAFRQEISEDGESCQFESIICDVTDVKRVNEVSREMTTRFTVRGIIHCGIALADRPIELMTHDEYATAVRPKVHGTLHLHNAFASEDLDFMILMSSSAGILGIKGQSNYAAGNTFQDAFATAHNAKSGVRTRYISLDFGAIAGSSHIERLRMQGAEMQRQSATFMSFHEVLKLVECAMSPDVVDGHWAHSISGITRSITASMKAVDEDRSINPIFSLMPDDEEFDDGNDTTATWRSQPNMDPAKMLESAMTMNEARAIIANATAEKFSAFLDVAVSVDIPISQLALDSLVSIELKNWMQRTFQAPIQASEIATAASITALSRLLAGRSKCISEEVRVGKGEAASQGDLEPTSGQSILSKALVRPSTETITSADIGHASTDAGSVDQDTPDSSILEADDSKCSTISISDPVPSELAPDTAPLGVVIFDDHGFGCCKESSVLLKLPLADLEEVLDHVLENSSPFVTGSDLEELKSGLLQLREPHGVGRQIYASLKERHDDPSLDSWSSDLLTNILYLQRREPLAPYSSFAGCNTDGDHPHTQSERAAILTMSLMGFRRLIMEHKVEPYWFQGKPTCNAQLRWLFDATREPRVDVDQMHIYECGERSPHIAVLSRGRLFKVLLKDIETGQDVELATLKATFEAILEKTSKGDDSWVGILTADGRASWAEIRHNIINQKEENFRYIETIETATFLLCLDDTCPGNDVEHMQQTQFNSGFNRWNDKTTQVVVNANGKSSFIFGHATLDGLATWRLSEWVQKFINDASRYPVVALDGTPIKPNSIVLEEFEFESTQQVDHHMLSIRKSYVSVVSTAEYTTHFLSDFGIQDLMAWEMPVKSIIDVMIQLAIRLHYKRNIQVWESVSMATYHRGRSDNLQVTTSTIIDFCTLVLDFHSDSRSSPPATVSSASLADQRSRLLIIAKELRDNMQRCLSGRSHLRILEMLRDQWPKDQPKAKIFERNLFWKTPFVMVNHVPAGSLAGGNVTNGLQREGCLFVSVQPRDHGLYFTINGTTGNTLPFVECLGEAAKILKRIIVIGQERQ